jgi:hypothetical protein
VKRLNITPALKKKQKVRIITIKTKKKNTFILIIIKEVKSEEDSDLIYKPEND